MIFPTKNLNVENSIVGIGSILLKNISQEETVSSLWEKCKLIPEVSSYEKFVISMDFLFLVGLIDFNKNGLIQIRHEN